MASTYRPYKAFDECKQFIKLQPLERVAPFILDEALKFLWMAAPWRWSVGVCAPLSLTINTPDQPVTVPADFLYIIRAVLTDGNTVMHLHPEAALPVAAGGLKGNPFAVSYESSALAFRLYPYTVAAPNTGTWKLTVWYKKKSPIITNTNIGTVGALTIDDEWFHVFKEIVLWKAYLYGDDDRAGGATWADGKVQYTGQLGVAMALLEQMKATEPLLTVFKDKQLEERRVG
jgi:hypothetical protein